MDSSSKQLNLQQSFSNIQTHCSNLLKNVSKTLNPLFNHNTREQQQHNVFSAFDSLKEQAKKALSQSNNVPVWARISESGPVRKPGLSADVIEERLAGVPVYALCNSNEEFVLVSGNSNNNSGKKKSLGFLFCKEEDAESLLKQMKVMDPSMRKQGSKVVTLALSKVAQLKVDGVAFRLVPESAQVKNALKERKTAGFKDDDFSGVPVFQSKSLILRSENKSYRPVFFRKEDLEKSLIRASRQQNKLNPAMKPGDIQVAVFEEIVKGMKENTTSNWDDIVFIPPGLEVSTEQTQD